MSTELLHKAAETLRDPNRCNGNAYEPALADWLDASRFDTHKAGLSDCRRRTMRRPNANGPCPACLAEDVARLIVGEQP